MPTYSEVINFESQAPVNVIRLVKSGQFYRAYNRSAWLFQCCIAKHRVMRKFLKSINEDIFYIGFPETSFATTIGNRKFVKTEYGFDVEISDSEAPDYKSYDTWRLSVITSHSSKGDFNSLPIFGAEAEKEVIRRLREFPMESKSMLDCAMFIAELRQLLSNS